jgi:DNA-binding NtrC family response regulator
MVSRLEPVHRPRRRVQGPVQPSKTFFPRKIMKPASSKSIPRDVLVVEDDPIIALDFEDRMLGFGVKTVRVAASVARALEMIDNRPPDFAMLDVGLVREKSFAIAARLDALRVPFVFVTGYGAPDTFPTAFADRPRLSKPCSTDALLAALRARQRPSADPGG